MSRFTVVFLCIICAGSSALMAQWQENGISICTETDDQTYTAIVPDGSGGAFIAWVDARSGNNDIYAQRLNDVGNDVWTYNELQVCTEPIIRYDPLITAGKSEDAIIVWQNWRGSSRDIFSQRIGNGSQSWTTKGICIYRVRPQRARACETRNIRCVGKEGFQSPGQELPGRKLQCGMERERQCG